MFSSSIHTLPNVTTWESAHSTFNNTKQPRSK
jgi:hypothetical protein